MSAVPTPDGRIDDVHGLRYPCGEPPPAGAARELAPGVLWLRLPLPFALNHINLWALADEDEHGPGWALVDTGTNTPETLAAWRTLIAPDGPLAATEQGARLTRVIVTHMHPDHVGMAGWLTRKFQCPLWMTRLEYLMCRTLVADSLRFGCSMAFASRPSAASFVELLRRSAPPLPVDISSFLNLFALACAWAFAFAAASAAFFAASAAALRRASSAARRRASSAAR